MPHLNPSHPPVNVPSAMPDAAATPPARRPRGAPLTRATALQVATTLHRNSGRSDVRRTLRARGIVSTDKAIDQVFEAIEEILVGRRQRTARRQPIEMPRTPSRPPVRLPSGTPAARLQKARQEAVSKSAKATFRHGAAGGTTWTVTFVDRSSEVSYEVRIGSNRSTYAGRFKGWSATEDHHRIRVPADWRVRVERRGLAIVDVMMTLDAHAMIPVGDVELYAATWARQGRGYYVVTERGIIARSDGLSYHGETVQAALDGIKRKRRAANSPRRARVDPYTLTVEAFTTRYRNADVWVTLDDARETGSCEYGIRAWCDAVGIDHGDYSAPIARVLEGFEAQPWAEVRRAVVHAVRSARRAKRRQELPRTRCRAAETESD